MSLDPEGKGDGEEKDEMDRSAARLWSNSRASFVKVGG